LEPIILRGGRLCPQDKPLVLGNALSFRAFGVFRGFNCLYQDEASK
jgi:hypothetical protein